MDQVEIASERIRHFKNIASYTTCSKLCNGVNDCSIWTYFSGACILKNNMVFTMKNSFVTSGEKYCNNSGKIFCLSCSFGFRCICDVNLNITVSCCENCYLPIYFLDCTRMGIDYFGGDIFGQRVEDAKQCAVKCEQEEYCKKWSFVEGANFGDCILMKGTNVSMSSSKYRISGFRNTGANICGDNGNDLNLKWYSIVPYISR